MKYLHTMIRVSNVDQSLNFYCKGLGLIETRRIENEQGRFTLIFLAAPSDEKTELELTYNWDQEEVYEHGNAWGHIALGVEDIYTLCDDLEKNGHF